MFTARSLPDELADLRSAVAADARVLDCEQEFETMPEDWVYELALVTDDMTSLSHPDAWVPEDAPPAARRTVGRNPAIGMPDDGSVAWTRQTDPPLVLVKPRAGTVPDAFRRFLIAEALVELGTGMPETPVCFFEERYADVHALDASPLVAFQIAAALRTGWIGLHTRERFADWADTRPSLHAAWVDAGERLTDRIDDLPSLLSADRLSFAEATELACSGMKHDLALPSPFAALDVETFADRGAPFALRWAEETID